MGAQPSLIHHGGWPFLVTAVIGRLPAAMVQLGLLMYVAGVGLGLGLGGLTVAAVGLGTAFSATLMGRLVDAFGPLPVVAGATITQTLGLVIIHLLTPAVVDGTVGSWALLLAAGLCGFANPQMGPIVRAHWSHLSRDRGEPKLVSSALGYEGAMDEMSFIVGPVAASLLVAGLGPTNALFTLMALIVAGQGVFLIYLWFARDDWRHRSSASSRRAGASIPFGVLIPPMIILLAVGVTFGATQTALTAVYEARGTEYLTGIVYGAVGIGSAITSLITARLPARITTGARLSFGAFGLLIGAIGFALLPSPALALVVAIQTGAAIGVILVTGFARAEEVAPSARIASVMTMMSMCLTLGVSIGAAVTGQLTDVLWRGFLPVIVAALVAMLAAALIVVHQRREAARGR